MELFFYDLISDWPSPVNGQPLVVNRRMRLLVGLTGKNVSSYPQRDGLS